MKKAGFSIRANVVDIPTAFVASYSKEQPVIAVLAEFDALPGLSQDAVPVRKPLTERGSGHTRSQDIGDDGDRLVTTPEHIKQARREFLKRRGANLLTSYYLATKLFWWR